MNEPKRVRVLVVDDSALERRVFEMALSKDPRIEVVGTAADAYAARDLILELSPDVLTLDISMPRMDGLSFLRVLQQHHPMPVVIVSSLTQEGSRAVLDAFALGAVDVVAKETSLAGRRDFIRELPDRVVAAASARVANCKPISNGRLALCHQPSHGSPGLPNLLLFGASTGGTEALRSVLTRLPADVPGIGIVQHFPPMFSRAFAQRLNDLCAFEVREAADGDEARPGLALVAPGDFHMTFVQEGSSYRVRLNQAPPVNFVRPSVNVLFESVAQCADVSAVAVLLTGMGKDGAAGMRKLKERGVVTIAQDEQSCVVYGMPRAAVELGAVDRVLPLDKIPEGILDALRSTSGSAGSRAGRPPALPC
jgi:two-component system chemotaxis response regulator CheB